MVKKSGEYDIRKTPCPGATDEVSRAEPLSGGNYLNAGV
jgi:hypothetical protein